MTHAFVPLTLGALRAAEPSALTRPKTSSPAPQTQFQPATSATIKHETSGSSAPHATHGEPKITLERQGDTITHIRVQCACGQVIELKCGY